MNPFNKTSARGRRGLASDDLDTLVRWGLRSSVEDAQPADAVWQRIRAEAGVRRAVPPRRAPVYVVRGLTTVPARLGTLGNSLMALVRFISSMIEAYDEQWPEVNRPRWAFTPGLLWIMLATEQRIY